MNCRMSVVKDAKKVNVNTLQIEGTIESKNGVLINVRVIGTPKTFQKNIKEIYTTEWLAKFSIDDISYLGFLAGANYNGQQVDDVSKKGSIFTKNVVFIGMFFISFLFLSNFTAYKIGYIPIPFLEKTIEFPAALIFFPITYFFSNVLTEVYGYKIAKMIIWCGFLCSVVMFLGYTAAVYLPPSELWLANAKGVQESYQLFSNAYTQVFIASSLAYFFGEFLNSFVLSKLKVLFKGRQLYVRVVSSTIVAVVVDSIIFCFVTFYDVMPATFIISLVITQILFKITYEIVMLPVTYRIVAYLKNKDGIDYYDRATNFNPFSIST